MSIDMTYNSTVDKFKIFFRQEVNSIVMNFLENYTDNGKKLTGNLDEIAEGWDDYWNNIDNLTSSVSRSTVKSVQQLSVQLSKKQLSEKQLSDTSSTISNDSRKNIDDDCKCKHWFSRGAKANTRCTEIAKSNGFCTKHKNSKCDKPKENSKKPKSTTFTSSKTAFGEANKRINNNKTKCLKKKPCLEDDEFWQEDTNFIFKQFNKNGKKVYEVVGKLENGNKIELSDLDTSLCRKKKYTIYTEIVEKEPDQKPEQIPPKLPVKSLLRQIEDDDDTVDSISNFASKFAEGNDTDDEEERYSDDKQSEFEDDDEYQI